MLKLKTIITTFFLINRDFRRLTTDVISSCAFGIDAGCISDENSKFYLSSKEVFDSFEESPVRLKITFPLCGEFIFPNNNM